MDIVVCIKQVPDTTNIRINPETNTLVREGVESIINPFDKQDVNPFDDLTLTYTVVGTPGTFVGNLIVVPEPGTLIMLIAGAVALLLWRRSRKA